MPKTLCYETLIGGSKISLFQCEIDNFAVIYFKLKINLTYTEAAMELGGCIMHALACKGVLDNGEEGEEVAPGDIDHDDEDRRAYNEERNERPGY